jgi:excisionase family DNA binding protein
MVEVSEAPRLLTTRQVAERLGVEPDTVRHLAKIAVLPPIRFGPKGLYRFRPEDVEALLTPRGCR